MGLCSLIFLYSITEYVPKPNFFLSSCPRRNKPYPFQANSTIPLLVLKSIVPLIISFIRGRRDFPWAFDLPRTWINF